MGLLFFPRSVTSDFDPLRLSAMQYWFDADMLPAMGVADAGNVPVLPDKTGFARDFFTTGSSSNRPTLALNTINSRFSAVRFTAANATKAVATIAGLSPTSVSIFTVLKLVAQPAGTPAASGLWRFNVGDNPDFYSYNTTGELYLKAGSSLRKDGIAAVPSLALTNYHMLNIRSEPGNYKVKLNDFTFMQTSTNTVQFNGDGSNVYTIGCSDSSGTYFLNGWINTLIITSPSLSDADDARLTKYLMGPRSIQPWSGA